ncbi:MAG TPA: pyruvate formate lyase family protein, partial [bacterium]|nr:pyruvate formate lyase family protein [bacterium]
IVPWRPARSFRQALLATNFIFYLDGCDSLGRFDVELGPYCEQDLKAGLITEKEAVAWVAALWKNFDANSGWNVALGGTLPDQRAAYNRLTMVCLKAIRKMRRPNLALRVRKDMPEKYFNQALAAIASGCGQPAFYHEEAYLQALQENHLNINFKDLSHYAFGGCTETMMHGMSNVGSLDGGLNLPGIMSKTLQRCLPGATSFKEILEALKQDISQNVSHLTTQVNHDQEQKAKYRPQPIRTLLVRDCLTAGREFNQGGARYNWSVINVGGLANVADSLAALKKLIFEEKVISPARFHQALTDNFQGWAQLLKEIKRCPRYGNDEDQADSLACEIASHVFRELTRYACWRGGRFLPGCLMFVTYVGAGENVPATPDGRLKDQPIADSIGPYFGREKKGPTAMLKSVAKLNQKMAAGTLVLNIRLAASFFSTATGRQAVKNLIRTYFSLGGMQVQVTVVDQAILKEAMKNPEKYQDLIVRVGGYSEYFTRLDRALQETIAARTEYSCP